MIKYYDFILCFFYQFIYQLTKKKINNVKLKNQFGLNFEIQLYLPTISSLSFYPSPIITRILGIFERSTTNFLLNNIKKSDTIIELGACYGYFTNLISYLAGENGKVFAYEPNIDHFKYLKLNTKHLKNTTVFNQALGSRNELIYFDNGKCLKVDFIFDKLKNLEHIDLLFIDIDAKNKDGTSMRQELDLAKTLISYNILPKKIFFELPLVIKKEVIDILKDKYEYMTITKRHIFFKRKI